MDEEKVTKLLSEYKANIELWKHDDNLRAQRNGIFLNLNALLLVALGTLITFRQAVLSMAAMAGLISIFGLIICIMWYYTQARNAEYIRFRRYQLRSIESQLGDITTISNQWDALNKCEEVSFKGIEDKFIIKPHTKQSVTIIEGRLPLIVAGFWLCIFVSGVVIAILHLFGLI